MNLTGSRPRSSLVSRTSRHARVIASGDPAGALSASPLRSPSRSNPSNAATMAGAIVSLLRNRIALRWPPLMSLRSRASAQTSHHPEQLLLVLPHEPVPVRAHLHHRPELGHRLPPLSPPRLDQPHDLRQAQALHRRRQRRLRIVQRVPVLLPQFHRAASLRLRRSGRQHRPEIRGGVRRCLREDVPRDAVVQHPREKRRGAGSGHHGSSAYPRAGFGRVRGGGGDDGGEVGDASTEADAREDGVRAGVRLGGPRGDGGRLHDARADLRDEAGN